MNSVLDNAKVINKMCFCRAQNKEGKEIIAVVRDVFFKDYTNYTGGFYHGKEVGLDTYDQPLYNVRPLEHNFDIHAWYFSLFGFKVGDVVRYKGNFFWYFQGNRKITKVFVEPCGSVGWSAKIYVEGYDKSFLFYPDEFIKL